MSAGATVLVLIALGAVVVSNVVLSNISAKQFVRLVRQ